MLTSDPRLIRSISTHSAREDGDITCENIENNLGFISTHSAREDGDLSPLLTSSFYINFNPLRPRGRRPGGRIQTVQGYAISTHSAREDGD